jgi:hypothetical protein
MEMNFDPTFRRIITTPAKKFTVVQVHHVVIDIIKKSHENVGALDNRSSSI